MANQNIHIPDGNHWVRGEQVAYMGTIRTLLRTFLKRPRKAFILSWCRIMGFKESACLELPVTTLNCMWRETEANGRGKAGREGERQRDKGNTETARGGMAF